MENLLVIEMETAVNRLKAGKADKETVKLFKLIRSHSLEVEKEITEKIKAEKEPMKFIPAFSSCVLILYTRMHF